jgi:hypothetical protein
MDFLFSAFPVTLRCFLAVSNNAEAQRTQENTSYQLLNVKRDGYACFATLLIARSRCTASMTDFTANSISSIVLKRPIPNRRLARV